MIYFMEDIDSGLTTFKANASRKAKMLRNAAIGAGVLGLGLGAIKVRGFLRNGKLVKGYTRQGLKSLKKEIPDPSNPSNPINLVNDEQFEKSLVLTFNSEQKPFLEKIASKKDWSQNDVETLFDRTQFMSFADSKSFRQSGQKLLFDERTARPLEEASEYDLQYLWIGLNDNIPGLEKNALPIDRVDAFRLVARNKGNVIVSPPQDPASLARKGFYSR